MRVPVGALLFAAPASRDRVGIPFWNGILSAVGATAIGAVVAFCAAVALLIGVVLVTGREPSTAPGHPLAATMEIIFYGAAGAFAWQRLRTGGRSVFRALTASDARTIVIGAVALLLVKIATGIALVATNNGQHVQSGFDNFNVVTKQPEMTALAIALTIVAMVGIGPVVEEIVFRGLLFGALAPRTGVLLGAAISALIFAAVHGDAVLFPTLAALGLINALSYAATGNLWVPITLHALNNALGATFLIGQSLHAI